MSLTLAISNINPDGSTRWNKPKTEASMNQEQKIVEFIKIHARCLHEQIGETIDNYMIANGLGEDSVTLNIVFNALSNNLQAIIEQNHDIPGDSVEMMIERLSFRLRKSFQSRKENQN